MAMGVRQEAASQELRCICGGTLEAAVVPSYAFDDGLGRKTVVHHVPAAICARCGDVQVEPETVAKIERTLRKVDHLLRRAEHLDYAAD